MERKGCIYSEVQRNLGKGRVSQGGCGGRYVRGVGRVATERRRWVGEISYYYKRYRFRSTNLDNVQAWLREMQIRFSD